MKKLFNSSIILIFTILSTITPIHIGTIKYTYFIPDISPGGITLSDSNITKQALAHALKELLKNQSLEKISIRNICEACGLNRKSFYYHFKDKYDLVNWIYDTEFIAERQSREYTQAWDVVGELCSYLYQNREFYQKTLRIEGQNSFSDYLKDIMIAVLTQDFADIFSDEPTIRPFAEFYADALICAIKKWLLKNNDQSPEEFTDFLRKCVLGVSKHIISTLNLSAPDN